MSERGLMRHCPIMCSGWSEVSRDGGLCCTQGAFGLKRDCAPSGQLGPARAGLAQRGAASLCMSSSGPLNGLKALHRLGRHACTAGWHQEGSLTPLASCTRALPNSGSACLTPHNWKWLSS